MSCNLKWNTKCYENKLLVSKERRDALLAKYYHKNIKCSENCENNKLWKKIDFMKTDLFHFLRMWMLLKSLPIWKEMKIKLLRLSFPFCNVQYRAFTINFSEDFFCKHVSSQIILYCQVHLFNIFTKLQHGTEYNSIQACKLLNIKTVFMNKQNTCFPSFE